MKEYNSVLIDDSDNVVTTLQDMKKGEAVSAMGLESHIDVRDDINKGHKVAIKTIKKDEHVIKYGKHIGIALTDILVGDLVHIHNIRSDRGKELKGDADV